MWKQLVIAMPFVSACVSISSSTESTKAHTRRRTSVDTVPSSLVYSATPSIDDTTLAISVRSEETCRTSVFASYREVEHTSRSIDKDAKDLSGTHPGYWALAGGLVAGFGGLLYVTPPGPDATITPEEGRSSALLIGAVSIPILAVALIDGLRLRDTTKDLGEVEEEPDVTTASCHDRPIANEGFVLVADGIAWRASGRSDDRGVVRFPLHDLPEEAFQTELGGMHLTLGISGSESVQLEVPKDETAALLAALASDATSRVAIDRAAAKAAADAKIAQAKAAADAKIAQAKQALSTCRADVARADFDTAASCWRDHAEDWSVLGITDDEVAGCLRAAGAAFRQLRTCVAIPERKDTDIVAKEKCLSEYAVAPRACGIFDLKKFRDGLDAKLDVQAVETRVSLKAAVADMRVDAAALLSTGTGAVAYRFGSGALELVWCQDSRCTILLFTDNTVLTSPPFRGTLAGRSLRVELKLPTGLPFGYPQFATVRQEWTFSSDATKVGVVERSTLPDEQGRLKSAPAIRSTAVVISCRFHAICSQMSR